jgi:hypothetical protein
MTKRVLTPLADRLLGKFLVGDGCWEWIASKNDGGYGQVASETRPARPLRAHRVIYEMLVGLIPEGMTLDHLCRNRGCVNPGHLEIVSRGENVRRGIGAEMAGKRNMAMTHCKRGHAFTPENTRMQRLRSGSMARACRACHSIRERAYRGRVQPSA